MTEREIDDLLSGWKNRLAVVAQNLVDLRTHPCYQRLSTGGLQLSGATAQRILPAIDASGKLFQHFGLIQATIDQALSLRRDLPMFGAEERFREIHQLLTGKSILLPAVEVPFEQRSLLSAVENVEKISPGDLLNTMTRTFEACRDGVHALDKAWSSLATALVEARDELAKLSGLDTRLSGGTAARLAAVSGVLDELSAQVERDPLAAEATMTSTVLPELARIRAELDGLVAARSGIERDFAAADATLVSLREWRVRAAEAQRASLEKVTECGELRAPIEDAQIDALASWLDRLKAKYREGFVKPVAVGLQNWNFHAGAAVKSEREAYEINRHPVELRLELRGRLDAFKAKARAFGKAEDPVLMEIARRASALLYTRPTPLKTAEELIARYEAKLNGRDAAAH